jgi:hypothetical protein
VTNVSPYRAVTRDGGSGPDDPALEQRIARIERILERLEPRITEIFLAGAKQADLQNLRVDVAKLEGKMLNLPTWWMLIISLTTTWSAGAAIVFALVKASRS